MTHLASFKVVELGVAQQAVVGAAQERSQEVEHAREHERKAPVHHRPSPIMHVLYTNARCSAHGDISAQAQGSSSHGIQQMVSDRTGMYRTHMALIRETIGFVAADGQPCSP